MEDLKVKRTAVGLEAVEPADFDEAPARAKVPKLNREQLRKMSKWARSAKGKAKLALVKSENGRKADENARKAEEEGQRLTVTSPERVAQMESQR